MKIDELINKDTELMPLVRWQFRGLSEEERRAFMFTNVTDAKGRKYDIPVVVGTLAASRQIYGFGLQCKPEEIVDRWNKAQSNPIPPKIVDKSCRSVKKFIGDRRSWIKVAWANSRFPSRPGIRLRAVHHGVALVYPRPETGLINIGNYRGHIKSPDPRTDVFPHVSSNNGRLSLA